MLPVISALLAFVASLFRSQTSLRWENLALRHQRTVYKQTVTRPRLTPTDRLFWAWLSRLWPGWREARHFVQSRTVLAWQRQRFRNHWRRLSRQGNPGRPVITQEGARCGRCGRRIRRGARLVCWENCGSWVEVTTSTVETYRVRPSKPPSPTWKALLKNHVPDVVALDFFTVPTVTFRVLCVLVILAHGRRRVVHVNVTEHPTAQWTAQQVVEAFPWGEAHAISSAVATASTAWSFGSASRTWVPKKS